MTSGAWRLLALLALLAASASAQVNAPLELTTSNFAKAAQQPIAWLINVEQSTNEQSRMAATMLKPALSQAVQYYHTMQPNKGVRVAHLDVVRDPQLRPILCESGQTCPPLVLYRGGMPKHVYSGSGSTEDVIRWVERVSNAAAADRVMAAAPAQQTQQSAAMQQAQAYMKQQAAAQAAQAAGARGGAGAGGAGAGGAGAYGADAQARLAKVMAEYNARKQAQGGGGASAPPPSGRLGPQGGTMRGTVGKPSKKPVDRDGDGRADVIYEDGDGDGTYENVYEDVDGDGNFETMHEDTVCMHAKGLLSNSLGCCSETLLVCGFRISFVCVVCVYRTVTASTMRYTRTWMEMAMRIRSTRIRPVMAARI